MQELLMEQLFKQALTFDDVLLEPGYTDFSRDDVDCRTQLTKNIKLDLPLVASPMDTVTESGLAIALAEAGGIGFIHRNLTIEEQARQVTLVKKQKLCVGAAVGVSSGYEKRAKALADAGADCILVDSAHGYSRPVVEAVKHLKQRFKVDVIAGSIATEDGAAALIEAGADGLRVGMGPGAICSTRIITGMGVPQLTGLLDTARIAKKHKVPVIADGGINYSGDIVKALAAGASSVMMGRIFAATEESPGKIHELPAEQVPDRFRSILDGSASYKFKAYRGMGSLAAIEKGKASQSEDEYHGNSYRDKKKVLIAEGVEGMVPCSGSVNDVVVQLMGGVRSGFFYAGARNLAELWQKAKFIQITAASLGESHPHDLFITNGGGNYA
jgi:IMP dehydrogenase